MCFVTCERRLEIGGNVSGIFPVELLPGDSAGKAAFAQFSEKESLWKGVSLWERPLHVALTSREEPSSQEQPGFAYHWL